jgi:hypothetical protein
VDDIFVTVFCIVTSMILQVLVNISLNIKTTTGGKQTDSPSYHNPHTHTSAKARENDELDIITRECVAGCVTTVGRSVEIGGIGPIRIGILILMVVTVLVSFHVIMFER